MKIEKGIPMPPRGDAVTSNLRKVMAAMKPGDSIVVAAPSRDAVYRISPRLSISIQTRKLDSGGYRVWRTK